MKFIFLNDNSPIPKKKKKNILAWSLTHRIAHSDHGRWCQEANRYVSGHPSMLATPWAELILLFENTTSVSIWWYVTMLGYLFFLCALLVFYLQCFQTQNRCVNRQGSQAEQSNDGQNTSSCNEWALGKNGRNFATLHQMRPMEKWVYLQTWMAGILWDQCNVGKYAIVPWRKCGFRIVIFQIFPSFRLQNLRFHIDDFLGVSPGRRRPHRLACRSESFPALGVPAGCSRQNGLKLGINSSHL